MVIVDKTQFCIQSGCSQKIPSLKSGNTIIQSAKKLLYSSGRYPVLMKPRYPPASSQIDHVTTDKTTHPA